MGIATCSLSLVLAACSGQKEEQQPGTTSTPTETGTPAEHCYTGLGSTGETAETSSYGSIENVRVAPNPENTLSFYLKFETDQPTTATVDFGEGTPTLRATSSELSTSHCVGIYGMPPLTEVTLDIRALDELGNEYVLEGFVATTGAVPESVPPGSVVAYDPVKTQPGWTLMNINNKEADWPPTVVIYDPDGRPVWYVITDPDEDKRGDLDASITPDGTVLVGGSDPVINPVEVDMMNQVVWNGPPQVFPIQHHHFSREPDGTSLMLRHYYPPEQPGLDTSQIVQIDDAFNVVWQWKGFEHMEIPGFATGDYTHFNSVSMHGDDVYVNSRNLDTLFKIDKTTGDVVWRLGKDRDFAPDPDHPNPWFENQHDPELQSDGTWLFYDNTGLGLNSRVVQVAIDEVAMTSEIVWEFPGDFPVDPWYTDTWYSFIWGDVDRLSNGNVLINAATRATGSQTRVFEVSEGGEVVWAMTLPAIPDTDWVVGSYRAERLEALPGLELLP